MESQANTREFRFAPRGNEAEDWNGFVTIAAVGLLPSEDPSAPGLRLRPTFQQSQTCSSSAAEPLPVRAGPVCLLETEDKGVTLLGLEEFSRSWMGRLLKESSEQVSHVALSRRQIHLHLCSSVFPRCQPLSRASLSSQEHR